MKPNATVDITEAQHKELVDPQLTEPSYSAISTRRSVRVLGSIITGNCLCSGCICLCLWGFSMIEDLDQWQKRAFNALSLLLSAALGFGIGTLLDRIGLLARGTILQRKSHSVREVCISSLILRCVWVFLLTYSYNLLVSLDWVYYDGNTIVVCFPFLEPGPYSSESCHSEDFGIVPISLQLSFRSLWTCISGFGIQSRGNSSV